MLNLFRPGHQFAPTFGLRIVRILDLQPRIAVILADAHLPLGDNAFQIVSAKRGYSLRDRSFRGQRHGFRRAKVLAVTLRSSPKFPPRSKDAHDGKRFPHGTRPSR